MDAKKEIIKTLILLLGLQDDDLTSLERATIKDLTKLQQAVIRAAHFQDNKK